MTRYVAFLRGVSPMNCRMVDLKRSFEAAGFSDVKTLLSSGNVAFTASPEIVPILEKKAEGAMPSYVERVFPTIIRPSTYLKALIERDHFSDFELPSNAKRVITFLRRPNEKKIELPIE